VTPFEISVAYVLVWRLAVLGCGVVAVVLGYRLFQTGFAAREGTLEATAGAGTFKVSNLAPGTFFALFGAAIIATLVWSSPPEIVIPETAFASVGSGNVEMGTGGIKVRSE